MANPLKNALEAQLNEARILQDKLQRDQRLFGTTNGYDWLRDGEVVHAHSTFTVGRWRSAYVEYTLPGYVAFGSPWFVAGASTGQCYGALGDATAG